MGLSDFGELNQLFSMPTIILIDHSLSMLRPFSAEEPGNEGCQLLDLAKWGIDRLLSHFEHRYRLEQIAVLAYSSRSSVVVPFTRDLGSIRAKLTVIEGSDISDPVHGISGVITYVKDNWGTGVHVDVVMVTDGGLTHYLSMLNELETVLPFGFPGSLHVMVINHENQVPQIKRNYAPILERCGVDAEVCGVAGDLNRANVENMFQALADKVYKPLVGTLTFGEEMSAKVALCPPPQPYREVKDFETIDVTVSDKFNIKGILSLANVCSPPVLSRHLVLTVSDHEEDESAREEATRQPTLAVFLHNGLKVEGLCALVQVVEGPPTNWFGIIFACVEKKKSSLMLALFEPGDTPVPWLGNLRRLGPMSELSGLPEDHFPVRASAIKPSYSSSPVVWIENQSLLHDIQRILRHSRKLPEKVTHFYKELNRLKRAACCLGFYELLDGVATIFEHESVTMPQTFHPDCSRQLRHAAYELRSKASLNVDYVISPP